MVQRAADAVEYQKLVDSSGYPPFDPGFTDSLMIHKETLRAQYGSSFLKENGWAAELVANYVDGLPSVATDRDIQPHWRRLGEMAGRGHLRSHYRLACHYVHGGPHGTALNVYERAGRAVALTGGTNADLAEPLSEALGHLVNVAIACLVTRRDDLATAALVENIAVAEVLLELADRADAALDAAERQVAENEKSYQGRLSLRRIQEATRWVGIGLNGRIRNGCWQLRSRVTRGVRH